MSPARNNRPLLRSDLRFKNAQSPKNMQRLAAAEVHLTTALRSILAARGEIEKIEGPEGPVGSERILPEALRGWYCDTWDTVRKLRRLQKAVRRELGP